VPITDADSRAHLRPAKSRAWGNRRPLAKRLDLTAEEAAQREDKRRGKYARQFLSVRMTDAEKETIKRRAASYGMKVSNFARAVLLSDLKEPPPSRTDPALIRGLMWELSKVGTNLNQLAARANEAGKVSADRKARVLLDMEAELRGLTDQIANALSRVIEL
jgi:Mobilization protein NikA